MNMQITVVEIDEKDLFEGVKVRNKKSGQIRTVKSIPEGMGLYRAVLEGHFDLAIHIECSQFFLNRHLFELVED